MRKVVRNNLSFLRTTSEKVDRKANEPAHLTAFCMQIAFFGARARCFWAPCGALLEKLRRVCEKVVGFCRKQVNFRAKTPLFCDRLDDMRGRVHQVNGRRGQCRTNRGENKVALRRPRAKDCRQGERRRAVWIGLCSVSGEFYPR